MAIERKLIAENLKRALLKEYILGRVARAGFGGVDIQRTPLGTRITITAQRSGLVIGKKGVYIREMTAQLTSGQWINNLSNKRMQDYQYLTADEKADIFKIENPLLEVQDVANPDLSAQISAQRLAEALERGWHFRRAGHSTADRIMRAGALGCQVVMSGKLTGARSRTEKITSGRIQYCGEPVEEWIDVGYASASPKLGAIGVTVRIMSPQTQLPTDIRVWSIADIAKEKEAAKEKESAESAEGKPAAKDAEKRPERKQRSRTEKSRSAPKKTEKAAEKPQAADTKKDAAAQAVEKPAEKKEKAAEPKSDAAPAEPAAQAVEAPAEKPTPGDS